MDDTQNGASGAVIRMRGPRDVLATVPRLLGYHPRNSIVMLNVHESEGVSTLRVDLPGPVSRELEQGWIDSLTGTMCKVPEVKMTVIVVYAPGSLHGGGDLPRGSLVRRLIARLVAAGFVVHDALCVAEDGWGAYDGADAGVKHPLDELQDPAPGDQAATTVAEGVEETFALPPTDDLARRRFQNRWKQDRDAYWLLDPVAVAEEAITWDPETRQDAQLALLLGMLRHPGQRDTMLFTWAWGRRRGYELLAEVESIAAGMESLGAKSLALDLMGIGQAGRPDEKRIAHAIRLVSRLAALAPREAAPAALTVLAWLHWSQGRGSIAYRFLRSARQLDPEYALAGLLDAALGQNRLPEWVYLRPST